ncbi:MAG: efflux RND transporter periplasmic adaptor subunit [Polyangiales bacterium]
MSGSLKRKRSWSWLFWLLGVAVLVGGGVAFQRARPRPKLQVRVHTVTRGRVRDLVSTVSAGRLAARREATIRAEVAGRVVRLAFRRGARVHAGDVLVAYDAQDLRDRVRAAETAVALAQAQAAQAQASASLASRNAARLRALSERGAAPVSEAETLEGQAQVADRAVAAAMAARTQGTANVAVARTALTRAVVRAPFDGVLLSTHVEEGEVTAPGGPLVVLADDTELHIDAELDEADLGRVRVGMPAEVNFDAFSSERFEGAVREIAPSVTQDLRGNRAVSVRVSVPRDPRFRVGMSADVDVVVATREDVVHVPPGAVLGRGTDRAVWLLDGSAVRRRAITAGITTWEAVEVTRGLSVGERVIVSLTVQGVEVGALAEARAPTP